MHDHDVGIRHTLQRLQAEILFSSPLFYHAHQPGISWHTVERLDLEVGFDNESMTIGAFSSLY